MQNQDIRLCAFDLDGTALLDDHESFSDRLIRDLNLAYEKGIEILPVTGRRFFLLPPALKHPQKWHHLIVMANGADIRNLRTGENIRSQYIEPMTAAAISEKAEEDNLMIELSDEDKTYVTRSVFKQEKENPELKFHYRSVLVPNAHIVKSLIEVCMKVHAVKMVIMPQNDHEIKIMEDFLSRMPVYYSQTSRHFFEISAADANKGTGLKYVCRMMGIPLNNVLYAGDSDNDIAAMKIAGVSIAMGSASGGIMKLCTSITEDCMHDGLAIAIEEYLHL